MRTMQKKIRGRANLLLALSLRPLDNLASRASFTQAWVLKGLARPLSGLTSPEEDIKPAHTLPRPTWVTKASLPGHFTLDQHLALQCRQALRKSTRESIATPA